MELSPNENIILEAKANLNPRGGKLILTNERLIFKPNKIHIGASPTEILRSDITNCEPLFYYILFVIPLYKCGIIVETKQGESFDFVVSNWSKWHAEIS
ncbi:MAG: GRAM domain-containing protein [Flavobacteriales bacterium]